MALSLALALALALSLAFSLPFTPGSVSVVRVGGRAAEPQGHSAEPVFVDEVSRGAEPALLQSIAMPAAAFALSAIDEREGDLDADSTGCALTLMGYALPADGRNIANSGLCPCTKDLSIAIVDAEGRVSADTRWNVTGNGGGGPGYVRANGAQLRPDGLLYAFAGRSAGCFVDLLAPGFAYQNDAAAPPPVGGRRAEIIGGNSGFSARGLQIAGREEGRLQLYAGSGAGLFRLGDGLPDAGPVDKIYVLHSDGSNVGWVCLSGAPKSASPPARPPAPPHSCTLTTHTAHSKPLTPPRTLPSGGRVLRFCERHRRLRSRRGRQRLGPHPASLPVHARARRERRRGQPGHAALPRRRHVAARQVLRRCVLPGRRRALAVVRCRNLWGGPGAPDLCCEHARARQLTC